MDEQPGAITVTEDSWGMWRARIPCGDENATGWVEHPDLPVLLGHARLIAHAEGLRLEVWDGRMAPGGPVCGWPGSAPDGLCGMPVESEYCTVHHPGEDGDLDELIGAAAAVGRHPLGRRGMPWLGVAIAVIVFGLCALGTFLAWRHR